MIANAEAEEAVLGAVALVGQKALTLCHQAGLRTEHFYHYDNLFREVLSVADDGMPVDTVTVPGLQRFVGGVPHLGNLEAYARQIIDKSRWRDIHEASYVLREAAEEENPDLVAQAERLMANSDRRVGVWTRDRLQDLMLERLERPETPGYQMPLGIKKRANPGTVWLIGAWTSHGKTVFADQIARTFFEQGARVWAWINEMTAEERICRHAASVSGIDLQRIEENDLTPEEKSDVALAMRTVPFEIVECPGWSAEEIARDIRTRQCDVAIIDILHEIPYDTERDLGRIMRTLTAAAKLAGVVVIATVHLNRNRIQSAARPIPTMGDIKGASAFEQGADVVCMVWREDDDVTGKPQDNGLITLLKVRQGKPESVPVLLRGSIATFIKDLTYA